MRRLWISAVLIICLRAETPVKFNRDIRPIMSDTCFRCHGPDQRARMAGMRLDLRDEALKKTKSGATPIVPGSPDQSAIVQRIFSTNARIMPPESVHKPLTDVQKQTIRRWIAEGAAYEKHWSYEPVKRPTPPKAGNAIDAFVQDRLAREGLKPSPEADRRTLLRRVTLDLTGIPPTPAEMQAFAADQSPDAYEKVVDRLLASPRYAEMQTMHWLDAVRYADSSGFHGDNIWPAWPYRDYVLKSFRGNKPFDQFTREQLAGDLLPNATTDQRIASAYNRLNRASGEGGLQPKEYLAKYGADRVRTLSTVWFGSTLGCAECHDHKFDPFTSKDFYSMKAFFADIRETGLIADRGNNAWGSKLMLPTPEQQTRLDALKKQIEAVQAEQKKTAERLRDERWDWEDRILAAQKSGELAWKYQRPVSASAQSAKLTIFNNEPVEFNYYQNGSLHTETKRGDGLIVASGPNPDNETYTVTFKPGAGSWTALGIDIHQDESLPGNRVARGADRFVLTEIESEIDGQKAPFVLATSTSFGETNENPPMAAIDGNPRTGWAVGFGEARNPFLALRFASRVKTSADSLVTVRLHYDSSYRRATIGRFRLALSSFENSWPENGEANRKSFLADRDKPDSALLNIPVDRGLPTEVFNALEKHEDDRNATEKERVLQHFMWASPEMQSITIRRAKLQMERDLLESSIVRVIYTERSKPRVTRVLARANWMDDSGEIVQPAVPKFLGTLQTNGRRATRLDLANWIVSRNNPLTARTFVNRQWRQFFGTGLSKTLEDLGSQGEWPTHPELLDWLASEFMQAWDVKHLIRTIVTSATYKQSSMTTPELEVRDPDNRLLARQSRFRVEAEIVHDIALSVSGLLVEKFGGASVRPIEPDGYLAAVNFPKREYSASQGDDLHRRALYTQWQRTFLHPTLLTFDAPTREECGVNRVSSNTPLQALVLLNDPIFLEASRAFAANILKSGAQFDQQLDYAFSRALNRTPTAEERRILADLHQKSLASFESGDSNAAQFTTGITPGLAAAAPDNRGAAARAGVALAAMTTVARTILNLHETITRN